MPSFGRGDAGGVAQATNDLYQRYGGPIFAYCLHQLRSREEAEDAVQTTFMNVFRALQRGTATHAEQAWLFKIAHNVCVARRSSSGRRLRVESPNDFEILQELIPSPARGGALELIGLEEALEAMPENQRRAILLREWQGLSYREIAAELELSQAAVEMLIFRARRSLASALEQPNTAPGRLRKLKQACGVGPFVALVKTLFSGGAAVKAVAVAVAAGTASVATTEVVVHHATGPQHGRPHPVAVAPRPHPKVVPAPRVVATHRPEIIRSSAPAAPAPRHGHAAPASFAAVRSTGPAARPDLGAPSEAPPAPAAPPQPAPPVQAPSAPAVAPAPPAPTPAAEPPRAQPAPPVATDSRPKDDGQQQHQQQSGESGEKDKRTKQRASSAGAPPAPLPTVATVAVTPPALPAEEEGDHGDHGDWGNRDGGGNADAGQPATVPQPTPASPPPAPTGRDGKGNRGENRGQSSGNEDRQRSPAPVAPTPPPAPAAPVAAPPAPPAPVQQQGDSGRGERGDGNNRGNRNGGGDRNRENRGNGDH